MVNTCDLLTQLHRALLPPQSSPRSLVAPQHPLQRMTPQPGQTQHLLRVKEKVIHVIYVHNVILTSFHKVVTKHTKIRHEEKCNLLSN